MQLSSPLDLPIPRNLTAAMQLLQLLVGPCRHRYWCGGVIPTHKLRDFVEKMARRYPSILRNARQRSYDRTRQRASLRLIVYPIVSSRLSSAVDSAADKTPDMCMWWLVSTEGTGGLADRTSPDFHVQRDAMSSTGHIHAGEDYVLAYVAKREPRQVMDAPTGRSRTIWKSTSTWTWQMSPNAVSEVRAAIDDCTQALRLGQEPLADRPGHGLRGLLAAQRSRPLFSGIRNQIIELHRYAGDSWSRQAPRWQRLHPFIGEAESHAVQLIPIKAVLANHLPRMRRIRAYAQPPSTIRTLLSTVPLTKSG